jgi:hypothetical protein
MKKRPEPRARKRSGIFSVGLPRARLEEIFEELQPPEPRLSWRTRTDLLIILHKILDQGRDTRVNVRVWQIAMLAAALVDERKAKAKHALLSAIETWAPEKVGSAKYRGFVEKTYHRLRAGKNPARSELLPIHPQVLELASEKLPKK